MKNYLAKETNKRKLSTKRKKKRKRKKTKLPWLLEGLFF